ncbi:CD151 antigen [Halyomorpha halys]|uniref:CD151 antigen n=1 Tax=Halyomorpha halys TaxID=286706 RepID=UPI0006D4C974|nr:tetraspanin-4 [Halyomorpha halys]
MLVLKAALYSSNFLFFGLGCGLMWSGVWLASEADYVNLSQLLHGSLPRPILYYLTFAVIILGVIIASLALIACSAVALLNKLLFALFIFGIIVLLIGESALIIFVAVTPKYLGLAIDKNQLVDDWQRNYGVPGREQYTAAVDYMQSKYSCCGVVSGKDFVTSWWKLRELAAPDLVVPLSCCKQLPHHTHLDPLPVNQTACQDEDMEVHRNARFTEGCSHPLKIWLDSNIYTMLKYSIFCIMYQLYILLSSIYGCLQFFSKNKS